MTTTLIPSSDLDVSPIEWTADAIVPRTGVGYVWGPPGSGKSLAFGIELGLAVSNGLPFFGHATIRGPVVYALGEGLPGTGIRKQARLARQARDDTVAIAAMARDHGDAAARAMAAALPRYADDQLSIVTEPFDVRVTASGEMSRGMTAAIAAITAQVAAPELVIMDAAGDFTGGSSLSSDSNANRFAAGLKALALALDCVLVVIAHPVAANTKMLGAGRLTAAADFVIEVQPDAVVAPGAAQTATVISRKSKDGSKFPDLGYQVEPATWEQPDDVTGQTVTVESATVRLLTPDAPARPPGPRSQAAPALPVLQEGGQPERPRKRSGIKPRGALHAVPDLPPAPPAVRRDLIAGLLSVECPNCSALGGGMGCSTALAGSGIVALSLDPVLACHLDRAVAAWMAGRVSEAELNAVLSAVA